HLSSCSCAGAGRLESKDAYRGPLRPRADPRDKVAMMALVQTTGLTKVFGDVRAVDDLSLSIPEGAIGLVGPNGAGKTTFLRLLLSPLTPAARPARVPGRATGD